MNNENQVYEAAFEIANSELETVELTQSNIKRLYPELFITQVSKKRRERLARGRVKVEKRNIYLFDEVGFKKASLKNTDELIRQHYSPLLTRRFKKLVKQVFPWLFFDKRTLNKDAKLLISSQYFDASWYAKISGIKGSEEYLAEHYLINGFTQLFDPSPLFSTKLYLILNPDVAMMSMNPLVHYLKFGVVEKRKIKVSELRVLESNE